MLRRLVVRIPRVLVLAALVAVGCEADAPTGPRSGVSPAAAIDDLVPGRVLARFRPGAPAAAIAAAHGARPERPLALGIEALSVPVGREIAVAAALARNPNVEFAEPDWLRTTGDPTCPSCVLPNDGLFGYKWDLHNDGWIVSSTGDTLAATGAIDADVDWLEAFDALGGGLAGSARVAILDTGVRSTHEDLSGRVVAQWDFYDDDPDASDEQGHGTHVAGIAAASGDNGVGLAGVGWGSGIGIMAAKVCTPTFFGLNAECPSSAIVEAITWAVDNGANSINLSLGGAEGSESERVALEYARANDVLPFCAAGNEGQAGVLFPAAFAECVAVAATDWGDEPASYSNWGPEVHLSAPGGDSEDPNGYSQIASTCFGDDAAYCLKAGTSMAAPQAAGLAALLYALGLTTDDEVLARMTDTAADLGPAGWDERYGHGRIDVFRAAEGLAGSSNQRPTADFTATCDGLSCDFTDASTDADGTVVAWSWDFGDGAASTAASPSHAYACAGDYDVALTVTDDAGATGRTVKTVSVASASTTPGEPTDLPDLVLWLRADAIGSLADGDPVASWPDASGACHHATQSTASKRPVFRTGQANGRPAVVFDATDDGMITPVDPGARVTILAVYASRDGASGHLLNGGFSFFMGPYVGRYRNYTGGYATGPAVEAGRWVIHTLRQDDLADELHVDGAYADETAKRADPGPLLLAKQGAYGNVLDGALAELLVYDRALTDAELATVHDWLIGRYLPEPGVNGPPAASFTESCADLECAFTDTSTDADGTVVTWAWSFGDGATSTGQHPTHAYEAAGTYTVRLEVTDDVGATDAVTREITVTAPAEGGPFVDPSSLPGLVLWLAADGLTGLADGDAVATWPDASGAGHDATQGVATKRPVFRTGRIGGLPALAFDADDDGMATAANPGRATTVLLVYASRAGASGYAVNGGFSFFMGPYVGRYRNYTGGYATGPTVESGRWLIHALRQSAERDELFVDGAYAAETSKTADPGSILLAGQGTYGKPLDGEVAEVLVYDRTLDDAELAEVTAWLKGKYGMP